MSETEQKAQKVCAQPACKCPTTNENGYCSEHCKARGQEDAKVACHCHHPACGPHHH